MKPKANKTNLLDAVDQEIERNPVLRSWFSKLPAVLQNECEEIKRKYHAGKYPVGSLPISTAVSKVLAKKNIKVSAQTVRKWLLQKNSPKT